MDFIYKYQPINDFTIDALKNNYLYFPKPSQINDPFDCRPIIIYQGNENDINNWVNRQNQSLLDLINLDRLKADLASGDAILVENEVVKNIVDSINLISFATESDNILMWSHYADNHQGICLKIKVSKQLGNNGIKFKATNFRESINPNVQKGFIPIMPIQYSSTMPEPINFLETKKEALYDSLFPFLITKDESWSYESEIRTLVPTNLSAQTGDNIQKVAYYPRRVIDGIIFGMNTPLDKISKIITIAKEYLYSDIKFYKATPIDGRFEIEISKHS